MLLMLITIALPFSILLLAGLFAVEFAHTAFCPDESSHETLRGGTLAQRNAAHSCSPELQSSYMKVQST